jgi:uroporphyrinogen decarboxylase
MTSRERFRAAINHKQPDRIPIDVGGDAHNGITEVAYKNLLEYLNETDEVALYEPIQHLARLKPSVYERLHADTRYVFCSGSSQYQFERAPDGSWADEWGVRRKNIGLYDERIAAPLAGADLEAVRNYRLLDPRDKARFEGLRERTKKLHDETGYAIISGSAASFFYLPSEIIGFEEYLEKLLSEPKLIETLEDKLLEWQLEFFDAQLAEIGDLIEMIWIGDDWGTQIGPILSPQLFKDIFVKRYEQFIRFVKSKADIKVCLHSCGSVYWAIEEFIKAGIDVLHPVQGDAVGMGDPVRLKKEFGDSLAFYSGLRNQTVLPHGTAADVEKEVREKIAALSENGGYIMSGGHNFQADMPPQNILAVIDTTLQYGRYS